MAKTEWNQARLNWIQIRFRLRLRLRFNFSTSLSNDHCDWPRSGANVWIASNSLASDHGTRLDMTKLASLLYVVGLGSQMYYCHFGREYTVETICFGLSSSCRLLLFFSQSYLKTLVELLCKYRHHCFLHLPALAVIQGSLTRFKLSPQLSFFYVPTKYLLLSTPVCV